MRILYSVFVALSSIALLSTPSAAQKVKGSGNIIKESRSIEGFTGIRTRGTVYVELTQGAYSIEVEAEDNVMEYVETRVVKDNLIIEMDDDVKLKTEKGVKVYLKMPDISFVEISEASTLSTKSVIKTEKLRIEATEASSSNFILDVKELRINTSGTARIRATGYSVKQYIKTEEASAYEASQLKSEDIDLSGSGSGKAEILAFNSIYGDLSEASYCKYYGEPVKVDISTSDAATVEQQK